MGSGPDPTLKYSRIKVGITMGDPSGIGPEIIAKALAQIKLPVELVVIGDSRVFGLRSARAASGRGLRFVDLGNVRRKDFRFGRVKAEYGRASIEYLDAAMRMLKMKEIDCLVTAPISKESVNLAGFKWPGHTEYLARHSGVKEAEMMLLNSRLKTVLATRHTPLSKVPGELKKERIIRAALFAYRGLKELFLIPRPRIAVCGLNPHASDNGIIGSEEEKIIKPAIKSLRNKIRDIDGPLPADTAILKAAHRRYDCVVTMYHDQALIPLKILGGYTGVNLTLGLPFVRTSPLHGTAFDIAAENKADPTSLIQAIKLAVQCTKNLRRD